MLTLKGEWDLEERVVLGYPVVLKGNTAHCLICGYHTLYSMIHNHLLNHHPLPVQLPLPGCVVPLPVLASVIPPDPVEDIRAEGWFNLFKRKKVDKRHESVSPP